MLRRLVSRFIAFCLSPTATLSRALGAAAAVCTRLRKLLKSLAIDPVAKAAASRDGRAGRPLAVSPLPAGQCLAWDPRALPKASAG